MIPLIEHRLFEVTKIDQHKDNGNIFVEGILATPEEINGNGRYYTLELWQREIEKFQNKIKESKSDTLGELDHPDSSIINLNNASHAIRKIWWEGNNVMGLIEIFCDQGRLGTPSGRILGAIILNKITVGVSSRGTGSVNEVNGVIEVQDDFELLTWDFVSNPSNVSSWMKTRGKLNENKTKTKNIDKFSKVNNIITEILCSHGMCPVN